MAGKSASDKKAAAEPEPEQVQGEHPEQSTDEEASQRPTSPPIPGSGSIVARSKAVHGKPAAVRLIGNTEIDLWNTVIKGGMDHIQLDLLLDGIKNDSTYAMGRFISDIEYQGFNREFYIKHALSKLTVSVFCRFGLLGAIRGSNFKKISETCEMMPDDLTRAHSDFVKTPKKRTDLTILRCTASIPHWITLWMYTNRVPKKIESNDCPAALQYPGAASLPMSKQVRKQHIDFCKEFSNLLPGGTFNANIYLVAYQNQIPVKSLPAGILSVIGVSSGSESYRLTDEEKKEMVGVVAKTS